MPDQEAPESLLLSYNSLAEAAIEHFAECCVGGMTQKQILMQLQSVCATYACQGVKRNAGLTDSKKKQQAATNAYKTLVVPGFLAWIKNLQGEPLKLPRWVDEHIMGCSNVNGKGRGKARKGAGWRRLGPSTLSLKVVPSCVFLHEKIWSFIYPRIFCCGHELPNCRVLFCHGSIFSLSSLYNSVSSVARRRRGVLVVVQKYGALLLWSTKSSTPHSRSFFFVL